MEPPGIHGYQWNLQRFQVFPGPLATALCRRSSKWSEAPESNDVKRLLPKSLGFVDDLWMIYGWFMDDLWMIYGWFMDELWMIYGWFMDVHPNNIVATTEFFMHVPEFKMFFDGSFFFPEVLVVCFFLPETCLDSLPLEIPEILDHLRCCVAGERQICSSFQRHKTLDLVHLFDHQWVESSFQSILQHHHSKVINHQNHHPTIIPNHQTINHHPTKLKIFSEIL